MAQDAQERGDFNSIVKDVEIPSDKMEHIHLSKKTFRFLIFGIPVLLTTQMFVHPSMLIFGLMLGAVIYLVQRIYLKDAEMVEEERTASKTLPPRPTGWFNRPAKQEKPANLNADEKAKFDDLMKGFFDSPEDK